MCALKILTVDDDPLIGLLIGAFAHGLGHTVVAVDSGEAAIARYRQEAFDLVLVDRQMPGLDGLATTRALRDIQHDSGWLPIIMLSASAATDEQVLALNAGCDDFIAKPINFQILEAKINSFRRISRLQHEVAEQRRELLRYSGMEAEQRRICAFLMERLVRREALEDSHIEYWLQPATEISGDLPLACLARNGDLYVMLADATGHGLPAALTLIPLSQTFYAMATKGYQLDSIAREMNLQHRTYSPSDRFVAALMAVFSARDSTIEVWNGGLPAALLLNDDGTLMRSFRSLNLPLGIVPDSEFSCETETVLVQNQKRLLMYSDGLLEAEATDGEPFGMQRLLRSIEQEPPAECLPRLQAAVAAHLHGTAPHDDLSCLMLDCRRPEQGAEQTSGAQAEEGIAQSWQFSLTLEAAQLRRLDLEPMLTGFCNTLGLDRKRQGPFSLILRELLANALDHGLLGLGSELKNGLEGFERYIQLRLERLEALSHGQIQLEISQTGSTQGNQLSIAVIDSGPGFDWDKHKQTLAADDQAYHGRGLLLVERLCDNLEVRGRGNHVLAQLFWGAGAHPSA